MVEEKFNYRHVGKPSQRQGHQGESRVVMILSHMRRGEGKTRGERCEPGSAARTPKVTKREGTKMVGLYGKGSPALGDGEFR